MGTVLSPVYGFSLPDGAHNDTVPADLLALVTALEPYFVGAFSNASARAAKTPSGGWRNGSVTWLDTPGRLEKFNGTAWGPLQAPLGYGAAGGGSAGIGSTTGVYWLITTLSVPVQSVPYRADVRGTLSLTVNAAADFVVKIFCGAAGAFAGYTVPTASPPGTELDQFWVRQSGGSAKNSAFFTSSSAGEAQDFAIFTARSGGTGTATVNASSLENRLEAIVSHI